MSALNCLLSNLTSSNFQIVKKAQAGGGVAVKIEHAVYQSAKMFGRHFDDKDEILSHISRQSIDVLKVGFFLLGRLCNAHLFDVT
jgi:translation initiation factor 5B